MGLAARRLGAQRLCEGNSEAHGQGGGLLQPVVQHPPLVSHPPPACTCGPPPTSSALPNPTGERSGVDVGGG
jgi:hypothetical protein